jgi:hypothetical protein
MKRRVLRGRYEIAEYIHQIAIDMEAEAAKAGLTTTAYLMGLIAADTAEILRKDPTGSTAEDS